MSIFLVLIRLLTRGESIKFWRVRVMVRY